ncbi:hypothetical protein KQX54_013252 [Cotesia glomerata]|uniref:Uncharacterized protein n=1 Tax=Cotesia glomerata TaxID=32391 RepID=A0AAV7I4L9_COTGL|nr:hypothetical protein KQX54_013252 [Cotesia glomerata]
MKYALVNVKINKEDDSKEQLCNPNFRIREPVITNLSSLESSSSDDDEEEQSAIDRLKEARKKQKQNANKSQKLEVEEIIKTYNKKTESFEGKISIELIIKAVFKLLLDVM